MTRKGSRPGRRGSVFGVRLAEGWIGIRYDPTEPLSADEWPEAAR